MGKLKSNLLYALISQLVVLLISIFTSFILPRILNVDSFGYWQLFLFYVSYTGVIHFGLIDGIYLRLGGKYEEEINRDLFSKQFFYFTIYLIIIAMILMIWNFYNVNDRDKSMIFYLLSINLVIGNLISYIGYVLQAVNNIKTYSISNMIEKFSFLVFLVLLFLINMKDYAIYMLLFTASRWIALIYLLWETKHWITLRPHVTKNRCKQEILSNVKAGFPLLVANLSGMLILGFARLLIEQHWGIVVFSKVSFALSLTNLFLLFVTQVSLVLFPALKRSSDQQRNQFYLKINDGIAVAMLVALMFYPFIVLVVQFWIPKYIDSLYYLNILLPMCLYEAKTQMLHMTYFKALRKEKTLLIVNVVTAILSIGCTLLGIYVLQNIAITLMLVVGAIIFRSFLSYLLMNRYLNLKFEIHELFVLVIVIIQLLLMQHLVLWSASLLYSGIVILFIIFFRKRYLRLLGGKYE